MKKILATSIIASMIIFSGCGTTGDDNNTTDENLRVLNPDNPRITLEVDPVTKSKDVTINLGETVPEYGYSVDDEVDGSNLTVNRTDNIDITKAGVYTVTYFVEDSDGFTDTQTRTVTILGTNSGATTDSSDDSYVDNPNTAGSFDLGTPVGGDVDSSGGYSYNEGTGSSIDSFKSWYSSVCNRTFNDSLYNVNTGVYNGEISCSGRNLTSITLYELSIFSTINGLDLSNNQLSNIDFSQLGLNSLTNNTKILYSLNLKDNTLNTTNFDLFRPLRYLKNINNLDIKGNNFNYTCDELYELRTKVFNNKSLDIDREKEQNCPSLQNK